MEWFLIPLRRKITSANPWVLSNVKTCTSVVWKSQQIHQHSRSLRYPSTLIMKITTNLDQVSSYACVSLANSNLCRSQTVLNLAVTKLSLIQIPRALIQKDLEEEGKRSWRLMNPCTPIRVLCRKKKIKRGGNPSIWHSWKNSKINMQRLHQRSKSSKTSQSC
jgi:hypothetical protein